MVKSLESIVSGACRARGTRRSNLMDVVLEVQRARGCVNSRSIDLIAKEFVLPRVEIESLVSFYSFLSTKPKGSVVIRLCDDIADRMHGYEHVRAAFEDELGIELGGTTPDGRITLERTACIGMSDQAPAALIDDVVVTELNTDKAREIVRELREHMAPSRLVKGFGDGANAHPLVRAMVKNNVRQPGEVIFTPKNPGEALRKAMATSPAEVIRAIKTARLRGRGGAGFPCGMKWEFTRAARGERKIVICNADEGEPGTFKDRVLLTEMPDRVFAGMTIAGYAIGAREGILYLRAEYAYLRAYLESSLEQRRKNKLLGKSILGRAEFDFEIRIQMGAGAYVCGEETALINSCEGNRGDPKNRPPFPAQKGFEDCPTSVNNVETLCCVTKILEEGAATFQEYGTKDSRGTKLLSISGDCHKPGIYEVEFGTSLRDVLELAGAEDTIAVQVGGPSGQLVGPEHFDNIIDFEDLATGGSLMIFGPGRDILEIVHRFMEFFEEESCGYCTPCRVGNVLLRKGIERIMDGRGEAADLVQFEQIARTMKAASRCGLGQTSSNPVRTSLANFRSVYESRVEEPRNGSKASFDLERAVATAEGIAGRKSVHAHE